MGLLGWKVTRNLIDGKGSKKLVWFANKKMAIDYAVSEARFWWKSMKETSELQIKNKFGLIVDKRTYGNDPRGNG